MRVKVVNRVEDIVEMRGVLYRLESDDLSLCNSYVGSAQVLYTGDAVEGLGDSVHYLVDFDGEGDFGHEWVTGVKRDGGVLVVRFGGDFKDLESCYLVQSVCDFPIRFVGEGLRSDMGVNVGLYGFDNVGVEPEGGYMCKGLDVYPVYAGVCRCLKACDEGTGCVMGTEGTEVVGKVDKVKSKAKDASSDGVKRASKAKGGAARLLAGF